MPFTLTALNLDERIEDFTQIQKPVAAMSYLELSEYVKRLEAAGFHARKYLVELYAKIAFPLVNLIILIIVYNDLSKSFGHGVGFTLGLIFLSLIFYYILAFGSSRYLGPAGAPGGMAMTPPPPPPMPTG